MLGVCQVRHGSLVDHERAHVGADSSLGEAHGAVGHEEVGVAARLATDDDNAFWRDGHESGDLAGTGRQHDDVALALHCPLGPIALAACLQVDAVSYNAFIQEQSLGIHYNESNDLLDYLAKPEVFAYDKGYVLIPQGPGLGIEINEAYVKERAAVGHRWRNPVWRHKDGSFAEW